MAGRLRERSLSLSKKLARFLLACTLLLGLSHASSTGPPRTSVTNTSGSNVEQGFRNCYPLGRFLFCDVVNFLDPNLVDISLVLTAVVVLPCGLPRQPFCPGQFEPSVHHYVLKSPSSPHSVVQHGMRDGRI